MGWAARWTSRCFDSLPTARYSHGSSLSLSDTLLRLIYVCVSPAFSALVCAPLFFSILTLASMPSLLPIYSSHKFLCSLTLSCFPFKFHEDSARKKVSSCYAVCLPPHPDLLLCFRVPEKAENKG